MANTIQDKLAYLEETKGLIKQSIIAKGVDVSDTDTFRSYANKIEAIQTGGGSTVNLPDGTKFCYSTFTTIPDSIIPYLETQTDMNNMFAYCGYLTTVPHFNTSKCTTMYRMFENCISLTSVPLFTTSSVKNMHSMFENCRSLTSVPLFTTSSVFDMSSMFAYCENLQTVPLLDTNKVTTMNYMFVNCRSLTSVPLLDTNKVTNVTAMFGGCDSLTNLGGFTGLKKNFYLDSSSLLTVESVMNVINYAADMSSSSEPKTLTLHQDVFKKLSYTQIATATRKGWNIAAS